MNYPHKIVSIKNPVVNQNSSERSLKALSGKFKLKLGKSSKDVDNTLKSYI